MRVLALMAVAVAVAGCGARQLSGHAIRLTLPSGWHGRIYVEAGNDVPYLQAASRPLAPLAADGDDARQTQGELRPGDVLIALWEEVPPRGWAARWNPGFPIVRGPLRVDRLDGPFEGQVAPAASKRTFRTHGRYFELLVFYGSRRPGFAAVNRALAGLRISARG